LQFYPTDAGGWIEFVIRNVPKGNYNVLLSFRRDAIYSSNNVSVYWRNDNQAFDWKSQLLMEGLNMRDTKYPEFGQNAKLGQVTVSTYGDYTLRFAHVDLNYGIYDLITLIPVR
jgi:hypothetical protein